MGSNSERSARACGAAAIAAVVAALLTSLPCAAQDDLTIPPRLTDEAASPAAPAESDPAQSTAAAELEEIVVTSDPNPWRLPDLGSSWRAQQAEDEDNGRIRADVLPLWDPDTEELPTRNPFSVTDDFSRVGFIEVFRVRFGRR